MNKWLSLFGDYVADLRIISKEEDSSDPRGVPLRMYESQKRFVKGVGQGLDDDIHIFNWLKGRQQGLTTVSLALDSFWLAMHDSLIGALVCDNETNKSANRTLLEHYIKSFGDGYFGGKFKVVASNRDQLKFSNGSRLDLLVAGTKKKSIAWAEGRGYTLIHATEIAKYGDTEGFKSLLEGFAQRNPHRLLVIESTANGYNHWRDRWYAGKQQPYTERSFFTGWWAVDTNRIERSDPRFLKFNYRPDSDEREKIKAVKLECDWEITIEQLAWVRWKEVQAGQEQDLLAQNQPWTAADAFVQSGRSFFHVRLINKDIKTIVEENSKPRENPADNPYAYKGYRYIVDGDFFSFAMEEVPPSPENRELVELKIWEEPVDNAKYCIGFDPAYGRSEHKDAHAIEVYRCYADKLDQVAEYVAHDVDVRHASWVFFHLCAAYGYVMGNVELTGPGRLVMAEYDHLRQLLGSELHRQKVVERKWEDAAANARWYLYHKPDSFGAGYVANFESNWRTKVELMHNMRSVHSSGELMTRSRKLLEEMTIVVIDGDVIGAPDSSNSDQKDDRVFGTALAVKAWTDWIRREQLAQGQTYEVVQSEARNPTPKVARSINSIVYRFLARQEEEANKAPERGPKWLVDNGLV